MAFPFSVIDKINNLLYYLYSSDTRKEVYEKFKDNNY